MPLPHGQHDYQVSTDEARGPLVIIIACVEHLLQQEGALVQFGPLDVVLRNGNGIQGTFPLRVVPHHLIGNEVAREPDFGLVDEFHFHSLSSPPGAVFFIVIHVS